MGGGGGGDVEQFRISEGSPGVLNCSCRLW